MHAIGTARRTRFGGGARLLAALLFAAADGGAAGAEELRISAFEDRSGRLTFDAVRALPQDRFRPLAAARLVAGYSRSVYWLRIVLSDPVGPGRILEVGAPLLDRATLFYADADGSAVHRSAGDAVPFPERALPTRRVAFPLPGDSGRILHLRVESVSPINLDLRLWSAADFAESQAFRQLFNGAFYGIMLFALAYNLFVFVVIRDRSYGYYVVYLALLIALGAGGFDAAVDLPGGARASNRIAVGDVNGDGHLDALISNSIEINQVMINDGTGSFLVSDLVGGAQTTTDIALGDGDGDGDLDALVANFGQPNQLLLNDGAGNFSLASSDLPGGSMQSRDIAIGDVDDDGDMDALVANQGQANQLLLNDGAGNFAVTPLPEPPFSSASHAIALGDIDGDNDLDAVVATFQGVNYRLINDGSGAFLVATFPSVDFSATFNSLRVALGDLDSDGAAAPVDAYGLPNLDPFGLLPDIHVI